MDMVYHSMKKDEVCLNKGLQITPQKWSSLVDIIKEKCKFCHIEPESTTFCLAVTISYQYFSLHHVQANRNLEVIAVAALWIADKYNGGQASQYKWKRLIHAFCAIYQIEPWWFVNAEKCLLQEMQFKLGGPTVYCFLEHILNNQALKHPSLPFLKSDQFKFSVIQYSELALRMPSVLSGQLPSSIAVACVYKTIMKMVDASFFINTPGSYNRKAMAIAALFP